MVTDRVEICFEDRRKRAASGQSLDLGNTEVKALLFSSVHLVVAMYASSYWEVSGKCAAYTHLGLDLIRNQCAGCSQNHRE